MQPVSSFGNYRMASGTALGTTTVKVGNVELHSLIITPNNTGTIAIFDSGSGTSNEPLGTYNCNVGSIPTQIFFDAHLKDGLTYVTSGTTAGLFVYE